MKKSSRETEWKERPDRTVGVDLGDRFSRYCVLNSDGEVIEEGRVRTNESPCGGTPSLSVPHAVEQGAFQARGFGGQPELPVLRRAYLGRRQERKHSEFNPQSYVNVWVQQGLDSDLLPGTSNRHPQAAGA
jgi:hypothetical protein